MQFDLAHALVSAIIILGVIFALRKFGYEHEKGKWSWPIFFGVFVAMAILNLIWPYGS
ncbi:hypothetical protein [Roseobacter ponti]|uniref:Uncharacterized protein n=1 Tax=Roseobacter ponti TaxID=1891787 RepID=A0A858SNA3_9RHOB|nr:hypothetical protein [Roseobacter ponti]QJF50319.1 hypothetical protein G3256_03630 [Roseobacter ponti]